MIVQSSVAEVIDRLIILELQLSHLPKSDAKRAHIVYEHYLLLDALKDAGYRKAMDLGKNLRLVNAELWDLLAQQRKAIDGGVTVFAALSKRVIWLSDERAAAKMKINEETGSTIREVIVH